MDYPIRCRPDLEEPEGAGGLQACRRMSEEVSSELLGEYYSNGDCSKYLPEPLPELVEEPVPQALKEEASSSEKAAAAALPSVWKLLSSVPGVQDRKASEPEEVSERHEICRQVLMEWFMDGTAPGGLGRRFKKAADALHEINMDQPSLKKMVGLSKKDAQTGEDLSFDLGSIRVLCDLAHYPSVPSADSPDLAHIALLQSEQLTTLLGGIAEEAKQIEARRDQEHEAAQKRADEVAHRNQKARDALNAAKRENPKRAEWHGYCLRTTEIFLQVDDACAKHERCPKQLRNRPIKGGKAGSTALALAMEELACASCAHRDPMPHLEPGVSYQDWRKKLDEVTSPYWR